MQVFRLNSTKFVLFVWILALICWLLALRGITFSLTRTEVGASAIYNYLLFREVNQYVTVGIKDLGFGDEAQIAAVLIHYG